MLNWITGKKNTKKGVVGIEAQAGGIAVAHLKAGSPVELSSCEFLQADNPGSAADRLRETVSSLGLKGMPCNAVLANDSYSVLLSEVPKVPEDELRDAMRWRIKDLSPIPVDQAVVDVFRVPEDAGSLGKGMAFTVVAKKQAIIDMAALVDEAGLKINAIDIPELCLRNIADRIGQPGRSVVVARLLSDGSHTTAVCNGNMYLNRNFSFHYGGGGIPESQVENLTLELQRSVDYIQHQMHQPSPSHILVMGQGLQDGDIPETLDKSFPAKVRVLYMADGLPIPAGIDWPVLSSCTLAIGAALRDFPVENTPGSEGGNA